MWHYFPRGPLENRVFKTRFIIQNFFKKLQVPSLTGSEQRDSDQREGDQIREREIIRSERERKRSGSRGLGSRDPGARPGFARPTRSLSLPLWSDYFFLSYLVSLSLIWVSLCSDPVRLGTWRFLKFFWIINRVFKTRFSSGPRGK